MYMQQIGLEIDQIKLNVLKKFFTLGAIHKDVRTKSQKIDPPCPHWLNLDIFSSGEVFCGFK